jgi:anti-sigma-K factor RskA
VSGDHETFDELAVGWALHALEPEDEAVFTIHLAGCDRCARTVRETVEVMASLATDLPPAEPSADLRSRLRDAVEQTEQMQVEPSPGRRPVATGFPDYDGDGARTPSLPLPPWRRALPSLLAAAAVALIVALGVWNVVLGESRTQAQATAEAQTQIVDELLTAGRATIAPVADPSGHSVATVVARADRVDVITHGLRVNDAARTTYVVWGMQSGGPVPLGTFDVVHTQMDLRTVGSTRTGLDDFAAYAVSLEPGRRAPPKPTDVVASGEVPK